MERPIGIRGLISEMVAPQQAEKWSWYGFLSFLNTPNTIHIDLVFLFATCMLLRIVLDHFTVFVTPILCGNRVLSAMALDAVSLSASLCC